MKLSCGMIGKDLAYALKNSVMNGWDTQLNLKRWVIYEEGSTLCGDTLYFMPKEFCNAYFLETLRLEPGTSVILWGEAEIENLSKNASWFVPDTNRISFYRAMNFMNEIFEKYQDYEDRLWEMVYEEQDIQHMVSFAAVMMKNELTVRNGDYQILARSNTTMQEMNQAGMPQPDKEGNYGSSVISVLEEDPIYRSILPGSAPANKVIFYHSDDITTDSYFIDLYRGEHFFCRVRLSNCLNPFRTFDSALLEHFAGILNELIGRTTEEQSKTSRVQSILQGLINVPFSCNDRDLQLLEDKLGWKPQENYVCACFSLSRNSEEMGKRAYYGKIMQHMFKGLCVCEYDSQLVAVVNLDVAYQGKLETFNEELVDFLRDENLRVGYSLKFRDLMLLQYYYHQAAVALNLGEQYDPYTWTHHFQNHIFDWMSEQIKNVFGDILSCDSALRILNTYDEEKGTELLKTLKTYLDANQNSVHASRTLHIHRATLNYRLERILELTNLNFKDTDRMILIHLFSTLESNRESK